MTRPSLFRPFVAWLAATSIAQAALEVHPARETVHRVRIQPIQAVSGKGAAANFMGSPAAEAYIKTQVGRCWAQFGIEVDWLPPIVHQDDFIYRGDPSEYVSGVRPLSDFSGIARDSAGPAAGLDPKVIRMFFVRVVPGQPSLAQDYTTGQAFVDSNGVMMYVGSELLEWDGGRDAVAGVIAHEIGHNLGLSHFTQGKSNLMAVSKTSAYLTEAQEAVILDDHPTRFDGFDLLEPVSPPLEYDLWAEAHGLVEGPGGDDDGDGLTNAFEFLAGSSPVERSTFPAPIRTPEGLVWQLPKHPPASADGFRYLPESGPDVSNWLPAGIPGSGSTVLQDDLLGLAVRLDTGAKSCFLRIGVELPETLRTAPVAKSRSFLEPEGEPCGCCGPVSIER